MRFTFIFIMASILTALILEWSLADRVALFGIPMPFLESVIIFWFWRIPLRSRIWLAVAVGFFLDTLSPYAWGSFIFSFGAAALATEFLQRIFTPSFTQRSGYIPDSVVPRGIGLGVGLFIVLFFAAAFDFLAEYGASGVWQSPAGFLASSLVGILLWAILIPFCIFGGLTLLRR